MTFKDVLPTDNENLLLIDELASFIQIDGIILKAIIDVSTAQRSGNRNLNYKGLFGDFTTVYFRTKDYCSKHERLPRHGERCKVSSEEWGCEKMFTVESCTSEHGIATLVLAAYRQDTLRRDALKVAAARLGIS